ncbi:MAG: HRDC domain-containing protein [Wenzhouxiangella sp.]|nr:HRDC domain-containing protein [Wenzhouxiangella sp.]
MNSTDLAACEPVNDSERQRADQAVEQARLLSATHDLDVTRSAWRSAPTVGLDTEFVRERTFFPRPGLIQASDGAQVWLLDAVAMDQMPALAELLDHRDQIKILHSVGEDMEVFRILTGTVPDPLFDTQIAAAMLGHPLQLRYEQLVGEALGVELAGGKARSDWCRRPLSRDLLTYAAQDVIWLPRLQHYLSERLEHAGRLDWLIEDCARLVALARSDEAAPPLLKVKGAGRLSDPALAALQRLAEWRESTARARDLPKSFVIRDEDLMRLAEGAVKGRIDDALRALPDPVRRRHKDHLIEILEMDSPPDFARPAALMPLSPNQRDWISRAQQGVRKIAEDLNIDPALIASKRELTRIARGEHPDWLDGWRGPLVSELLES